MRGNRVDGPGLEFWGGSFLADPFGRVIAKAAHDKEEILIGEIDLRLLEDTRRTPAATNFSSALRISVCKRVRLR